MKECVSKCVCVSVRPCLCVRHTSLFPFLCATLPMTPYLRSWARFLRSCCSGESCKPRTVHEGKKASSDNVNFLTPRTGAV